MKRTLYNELKKWKTRLDRKPLLLQGARQVGKTWLMQEFGKNEYKNFVYVNFDKDKRVSSYFDIDISPKHIITSLENKYSTKITPRETLIIFDEVQESSRALNSLKYFYEDMPQYHVIAAGSFLGVTMHGGFPVGKVDRLTLYPLSFYEFLDAIGKKRYLKALINLDFDLARSLSLDYNDLLKIYFYIGGMPKVVASYAQQTVLDEVRIIQDEILEDYKDDFSKHINFANIAKVNMIWESIAIHLSKEKKKFMYKDLKEGARAYAFEDAMNWLFSTRLVYKVSRTIFPKLPLVNFQEREAFKLYVLDIGLLSAKAKVDIKTLLEPNYEIFSDFNGAMTEQFVLQELKSVGETPFYWGREKGAAEIDFILQWQNEVVPIEVKSGIRKKSKSLDFYMTQYRPMHAIRTSLNNYGIVNNLYSIPLYMISSFKEILKM
ncbi:MAG: ATP-binding protein [Endomicrobium sp.]|nr:ATP-binding protein [Endomicrobium sp.]